MKRLALLSLMLAASALSAAPVPKELKTQATTVGTWRLGALDPKDRTVRPAGEQYWIIDADGGVIFTGAPARPTGAKPTEIFKFDPKTGEVDHNLVGGNQKTLLGRYELRDDLLTISLSSSGQARSESASEGNYVGHLQRVKETK